MNGRDVSSVPFHLVLPLLSALVYVAAAMFLKRAAELGADLWRTARICNFTVALVFLPLLALGGTIPPAPLWWQPLLVALFFMAGQIFTLLALNVGDVSVATPVLGVKIPMVAFLTTVLVGEHVGPNLWAAAVLSSAAIALLGFTRPPSHHHVGITIMLATGAAASYASLDVLVQKWSPVWGIGRLLPIVMVVVAVVSLALPSRRSSKPELAGSAGRCVLGGAVCLGLQAILFISAIALYGQATVANVLYSTRGLWSVVAVWLVGHWFGNRERQHGGRVVGWRLVGAALLMLAIVIAIRKTG